MSEEISEIADQIRQEVEAIIGVKVQNDTELLEQKILDSINVIDLSLALEDRFGIKIDTPEIKPENFESCEKLAKFVLSKQQ